MNTLNTILKAINALFNINPHGDKPLSALEINNRVANRPRT